MSSKVEEQQPLERKDEDTSPGFLCPPIGFIQYKYVALILLLAQTVGAILMLRISRTIAVSETPYLNTTAVFFAEIIKLIGSFLLVCREECWSIRKATAKLFAEVIYQPKDTLKVGIPAVLYTFQNNLLFIALSNMSPALYQVTYQLKILSTGLLSWIILRKHLGLDKWVSLVILTLGVGLIQIPAGGESSSANQLHGGSVLIGTTAVLLACLTSGFAGVYFEKILKSSKTSIWMRNIQLALLGSFLAFIGSYWNDYDKIKVGGFVQGYNWSTWTAILMQSAGGLIVAAVLKYADNILKCFANAVAIVLSCLTSYLVLGDFTPTPFFALGTVAVIFSTYTYGTSMPITANFPIKLIPYRAKKIFKRWQALQSSQDPKIADV